MNFPLPPPSALFAGHHPMLRHDLCSPAAFRRQLRRFDGKGSRKQRVSVRASANRDPRTSRLRHVPEALADQARGEANVESQEAAHPTESEGDRLAPLRLWVVAIILRKIAHDNASVRVGLQAWGQARTVPGTVPIGGRGSGLAQRTQRWSCVCGADAVLTCRVRSAHTTA